MHSIIRLLVWVLFFITSVVHGQKSIGGSLKYKSMIVDTFAIKIDDHTLMPNSVSVLHHRDTLRDFSIRNNTLVLSVDRYNRLRADTIFIQYRTFGFDIEKPYITIDSSILTFKEKTLIPAYEYRPENGNNALINAKGLDYRGSFSRGLSVGNAQSLVLNSNFDMQLIGDLGNGLKVVAAISDENLPIQAQGNTQQLQEFDKVFIQVSKGKSSVTAGDYELRRPNGYFMNYFKKLKGISVASTFNTTKTTEVFTKGSFAISRGKFARQSLATKEGNQGPYRLQGNNGERFIIVLAGTEKVFFNGNLLTRGFDYDYVIDYNRAEIAFSPTRVVARDSRVIIEFEYTDISYLRSLYATQTEFKGTKWSLHLNMYSEQDSKNATGDVQLDSTDINILQNSGDDLTKSVRKSLREVSEEEKKEANRILYAGKIDSFGSSDTILYFTENLDSALYTAVFSEVGQGRGDYVIDNTKNKNGRVYKYVGKNEGTYLPVVQLIPPEQKQLVTLGGHYALGKQSSIFAEMGLSNVNKNRLSALDNEDNTGISSHVALSHSMKLDSAASWKFDAQVKHEFVHKNFKALNPFRSPEFVRDWNTERITGIGDEQLLQSSFSLSSKGGFGLLYGFNKFDKGNLYLGDKHEAMVSYQSKKWNFKAYSNFLASESTPLDQSTNFIRPNLEIGYKLGKSSKWTAGFVVDAERNLLKSLSLDTLENKSYGFQHLKWFVTNDFTNDFALKLAYSTRDDYFGKSNALQKASVAREIELAGKWLASDNSDLSWSVIGRELDVRNQELLPSEKSKMTILGRIDYNFSALNQGIRSTTSYNTNSGQEPRIEYVFQQVEPGLGDYVYTGDSLNPNLTIVQDFRYAPSDQRRNFIRLSLTNNEFIRTNNIEINQSINIDPAKFKKPKEGKKLSKSYLFISKFSAISNIRITKKQMGGLATPLISFIDFGIQDTSLVSYNALYSNTVFFNRGNVKYDIQIGNRNNQNRIIQVSGREDRGLQDLFVRSRWNVANKADLFFILEKTIKTYASESFDTRNLDILIYRIRPEISYRPSTNTRLVLKYAYQDKKQQILTKDVAFINDVTSEFTFRKASHYSLDFSFSLVQIKYSGRANDPLEYDILDGLKNGRNYLWNTVYTKRIAKNIDLTIHYEGRKAGISPIIHVGRAQVKATF